MLLEQRRVVVRLTREPGGTALGETLRSLVLSPAQKLHPETETLLMFAARRAHLDEVILPALAAGSWVLCDRFTDATFAYQAGGSGVAWDKVGLLEQWVQAGLQPDLTLYFDVAPAVAKARAGAVRSPDRFEQERESFHGAVRSAYLRRAREFPTRIQVIDAKGSVEQVRMQLEDVVETHCFE